MKKRFERAAVVLVVVFVAAQFVRPEPANSTTDPNQSIQAQAGTASGLAAALDRSCGDCHSNHTVWPWYTQVAPLSCVMASTVTEARKAVNFSEWGTYSPAARRTLLSASCDDVSDGKMPGPYTWVRPEARLSPREIETICAAARQAEASAAP